MGQTEPLDGLLRVTAPHAWVIVAGLGLAILTHRRRWVRRLAFAQTTDMVTLFQS